MAVRGAPEAVKPDLVMGASVPALLNLETQAPPHLVDYILQGKAVALELIFQTLLGVAREVCGRKKRQKIPKLLGPGAIVLQFPVASESDDLLDVLVLKLLLRIFPK